MKKSTLIIGGIVLLLALTSAAPKAIDDAISDSYDIIKPRIRFRNISVTGTQFSGGFDFLNKTGFSADISTVIGDLVLENQSIGVFELQNSVTVVADGSTSIDFDIHVDNITAVTRLIDVIREAAQRSITVPDLRFIGSVVVSGVNVPFDIPAF